VGGGTPDREKKVADDTRDRKRVRKACNHVKGEGKDTYWSRRLDACTTKGGTSRKYLTTVERHRRGGKERRT